MPIATTTPIAITMPNATLPQRNTFVHFEDQELPVLAMDRSVTCPGNFVPLKRVGSATWTPCAASSMACGNQSSCSNMVPLAVWPQVPPQTCDSQEDVSPMRRTESVNTAYAWPQPYAPQNTAVQLPATSHIDSCSRTTLTLPILPRAASVTDADLPESDRNTPFHYASGEKKQWKDLPEDDEGPDGKAHQNSTTDLSEDDQSADSGSPAHGSSNADCSEDGQELLITEPAAGTLVKSSRRWADLSEDEEMPAFQDTQSSVDQKVLTEAPAKAARRWADLSEDEQTPAFQDTKSLVDQKILRVASAKADLSEDEQTRFQQKTQPASISAAGGKKRWADVSEDDWSETDSRNNARMGEMTESDNEQDGPDEQDLFDKTEPSSLISTIDDDKESQPGLRNKKRCDEGWVQAIPTTV